VGAFHGPTDQAEVQLDALSCVSTVNKVIGLVPVDYQSVLDPPLHFAATQASKLVKAHKAFTELKAHKVQGTFPAQIQGLHKPSFQLAKEFDQHETSSPMKEQIKSIWERSCKEYLDSAIDLFDAEVMYFETSLKPESWFTDIGNLIHDKYHSRLESLSFGKIKEVGPDEAMQPIQEDEEEISHAQHHSASTTMPKRIWVAESAPGTYHKQYHHMLEDAPAFVQCVIDLVISCEDAQVAKSLAKKLQEVMSDAMEVDEMHSSLQLCNMHTEIEQVLKEKGVQQPHLSPSFSSDSFGTERTQTRAQHREEEEEEGRRQANQQEVHTQTGQEAFPGCLDEDYLWEAWSQ